MRLNYEIALVGEKVILVPYRPEHVPRYHDWMKDPQILEATGSEPLSFEEEVEMQKSWRDDETKCTFIVHDTDACQKESISAENCFQVHNNLEAMVGDVNLFLSEIDDEEHEEGGETQDPPNIPRIVQAEIDIMIAEKNLQRKGLGRAATSTMLLYGSEKLSVERFFCKINDENVASIKLFESLGFVQCNYAECFKQIELELRLPLSDLQEKLKPFAEYKEVPCPV